MNSQICTPFQRSDPNKDRQWTELDESGSFVVLSDEEEEDSQVQEVQEVPHMEAEQLC